jgi:putative glycosyltransferase (TIGR04372 family)
MKISRWLKKTQLFYETRLAPWMAKHAWWIFWPAYQICRRLNICFVVNIAGGPGHIICELDYFFRRRHVQEIDPNKRYVWVRKADVYSLACVQLYGHQFWWTCCSYFLYELFLPLILAFPDIALDSALSRLKWQLTPQGEYFRPLGEHTYLHQISKKEGLDLWCRYYALRSRCPDYAPLREGRFQLNELSDVLKSDTRKIALIHAKTIQINATAAPLDPKTYLPAMQTLLDRGYRLIFVGRETMPQEFTDFPIFNYAQSPLASFKNDIELFNASDLMILSGSGIAFLADCFQKPYLYLNSWHLPLAMFSSQCLMVPTLVQNRKSGQFLKLKEQMSLYHSLADEGDEVFPDQQYVARNASADEIVSAINELMQSRPPTQLQMQYRNLDPNSPLFFAQARCSDAFLQNHANLLAD